MRKIYLIGALLGVIALTSLGVAYLRPVKTPQRTARPVARPPAPQPVRHLAPDGVYFTLRYLAVRTPHGVTGILPATKVVRVRDIGSSMLRVSAGETEFDASMQDLTNDLDVASTVSKADTQTQRGIAGYLKQQSATHQKQQDEANRLYDQQQRDLARRRSAAPVYRNPLEKGAYNRTEDNVQSDASGRTYWTDIRGRNHYTQP